MGDNEEKSPLSSNSQNSSQPSSLKKISGIKIIIALLNHCKSNFNDDFWDDPNIETLEFGANEVKYAKRMGNLRWRKCWGKIEENIKHNLNTLELPKSLEDEVIDYVKIVETNLREWMLFLFAFEMGNPWEEDIVWTERGSIDWYSSIEKITDDPERNVLQTLQYYGVDEGNIDWLKRDPFGASHSMYVDMCGLDDWDGLYGYESDEMDYYEDLDYDEYEDLDYDGNSDEDGNEIY